ncbi:MAG TPA: hypothetical protein VMC79_07345 [Rectinemataceae bacterium]|nr:hypothetical protein [Rectinemataceae bacterium]
MKLEINTRGNGACPLCASNGACKLQNLLSASIVSVNGAAESGMEIVVYSCPHFTENA